MRLKAPSSLVTGALFGFIVVGSGVGVWKAVRAFAPCPTVNTTVRSLPATSGLGTKTVDISLAQQGGGFSARSRSTSPCTSSAKLNVPLYWDGTTFYIEDDENGKRRFYTPKAAQFAGGKITFDFTRRVNVTHQHSASSRMSGTHITVFKGIPASF
jgi:hypothetical protein